MRSFRKIAASVAVVSALALTGACGSDATRAASKDTAAASQPSMKSSMGDRVSDPAANLVGPGCGDYAKAVPDGAGSVQGMAQDPVAVAASNNPLLKTLAAAVSGRLNPKVNLVGTLNGAELTVFAPVDAAFAKLPQKTVKALADPKNADLLTSILTYHVVPGQITPQDLAGSTQTTVQGGKVRITGSGEALKVNGANVICGGVQAANATIYLIDSVLMPKM